MQKKIHPWQREPVVRRIVLSKLESKPTWSMVMPVFNQHARLREVLSKIVETASLPFEMILVNDGSDDSSLDEIDIFIKTMKKTKPSNLLDVVLIDNQIPIFETACDNQGFRASRGEYIIEIQSDLHIEEYGFDRKMIDAMNKFNLGAVSGRHVHCFSMIEGWRRSLIKYPVKFICWRILNFLSKYESAGLTGEKLFDRKGGSTENCCYIGETVARGPWLLRRSDLVELDYLDESNFFLGNDDHDYHRRLYTKLKKEVGYVPIDVFSIRDDGSSRKPRSGVNKKVFEYLKINKNGSSDFRRFMWRYRPYKLVRRFEL